MYLIQKKKQLKNDNNIGYYIYIIFNFSFSSFDI